MKNQNVLAAAALVGLTLAAANALASAPAGVWVKVRQVVYAPDAANPTHVQVHGALMLFDGGSEPTRPYTGYTPPALGYVYYQCPAGQAEICRQEWRELEANIAKPDAECLGFGMTTLPTGTLRLPRSVPQSPDVYPIQSGVSPGFSPCRAIAQFLSSEAGGAGGAGGQAGAGEAGTSTGGVPMNAGRAGAGASSKPTVSGGAGATTTSASGSGSAGAAAGGQASVGSDAGNSSLSSDLPKEVRPAESKAAGCSITAATSAASLLGLGAALSVAGLALARRRRGQ